MMVIETMIMIQGPGWDLICQFALRSRPKEARHGRMGEEVLMPVKAGSVGEPNMDGVVSRHVVGCGFGSLSGGAGEGVQRAARRRHEVG
jgi:hypothetical protein